MNDIKPKPVTMTEQQFAVLTDARNNINKAARQSLWKLIPLALSSLIFLTCVGVDVAIAYSVFSGLLQGTEDPVVQHSAGLLSMTAIIAMLTYHWISKNYPDSWPVRTIRNLSMVFAPLYMIAGGLFLGILLFPGAIATATPGIPDSLFGLPVEDVSATSAGQSIVTWLQNNLVLAAPLFTVGVMGIAVMGLFVGSQCIDTICTNSHVIFRALSNQKIVEQAWTQLLADDKACRKVGNELTRLKKRNEDTIKNQAALLAAGFVDQFVKRAEAAIEANPALFTDNQEPDTALGQLFGKQPNLSYAKARIDILKKHDAAYIRKAIDRNLK